MMSLTKNWWLVVLRGALAVLFGLTAFLWPGLTLLLLIILFGVYALADGVVVQMIRCTNNGRILLVIPLDAYNEKALAPGQPTALR